jgi:hypothetical protein
VETRNNLLSFFPCLTEELPVSRLAMEKKKVGFNLPQELIPEMRKVEARVSGKEKWVVVSAALVLFLKQAEAVQNHLIGKVKGVDAPGRSIKELLVGDAWRIELEEEEEDEEDVLPVGKSSPPKARSEGGPAKPERPLKRGRRDGRETST